MQRFAVTLTTSSSKLLREGLRTNLFQSNCQPHYVASLQRRGCASQSASQRPHAVKDPSSSPNATETSSSAPTEAKKSTDSETNKDIGEPNIESVSKLPDVPSNSWSSIGFEPQDANDPNKWKKFLWKYAGAVILFFISYKTLHWYVDSIEADGKQQKKNLEENREFAEKLKASETHPSDVSGLFKDVSKEIRRDEKHADLLTELDTIKEDEAKSSSELEELYRYRDELQERMRVLRKQGRTSEIDAEKKDVHLELKALWKDIRALESK